MDKTGPEGSIDSLMQHGQGEFEIAFAFKEFLVLLLLVGNSLSFLCLRCCACGWERSSAALLGRKCWWFELGGCT